MNPLPAEPVNALLNFLREADGYALLRNSDIIANLARGGDIDILAGNPKVFTKSLLEKMGSPLMAWKRSYVWSFFWRWGHVDIFLPSLNWHGAVYLPTQDVLQHARRNKDGILEASTVHQAFNCWLTSLLWGGFFKDRYRELIVYTARGREGGLLNHYLAFAFGYNWASKLIAWAKENSPDRSAQYANPLRRVLWWKSIKRAPFETLKGWLRFWITELYLRINPSPPWISLMGPDGNIKTTIISVIRDRLARGKSFISIYDAHWRAGFIPPKSESAPAINFHRKSQQPVWITLRILFSSLMNWILEYWLRLVHLRAKGYLLVFDHHPLELRVNPCPFGKLMWMVQLLEKLVPQPDLFIFLDLPAEVAHSRQPEIPVQELQHLRERYLRLAQTLPNAHVIDANRPLEEIVEEVEDLIIEEMRQRTQKHLQRLGLL